MNVLSILLAVSIAVSLAQATEVRSGKTEITISGSAEAVVAEMSDEQARRLLIASLKKEAAKEVVSLPSKEDVGRLAGFIETIKNKVILFQERMEFLRSGEKSDGPKRDNIFSYLKKADPDSKPVQWILIVCGIFVAAFIIERLFLWYSAPFKDRMAVAAPVALNSKIGRLILRAIIDGISMLIFVAVMVVCFYLFVRQNDALRTLLATYLSAIAAVRIVLILSRFFLSPKDPSSRFLPMTTPTANYLHRWILVLSVFMSFGLLTCGIMRLTGASEAEYIRSIFLVSCLTAALLIVMILQKRQEVADALSIKFPGNSLWAKMMCKWHHFAVFFVLLLLIVSMGNQLMGGFDDNLGIKTILLIPLYFLADWFLNQMFKILFGFIPDNVDNIVTEEAEENSSKETPDEPFEKKGMPSFEFGRRKDQIVSFLRIALAGIFIIGALNLWGIELPIGKAVSRAAFNILLVSLVCYVFWEFLNALIQRRLKLEMPDDDEDFEEGHSGGSRIVTLLALFRKFMLVFIFVVAAMIVLSELGVNIGPMLAGAGVLGLAIGFGAQTLVKDIISGVFFLMDDAFRIGDYIVIGSNKGTVEQISIRSMKLRHPRGMLNTLPFGDISTIVNFSRDYIITKLDFRVRYDTDIDKVRKLIKKKVNLPISEDKVLGPKLLGKIKSQGVRQMDDSAMIMRVKYKTLPGDQFAIRKEVYRLLQEAFKDQGIEFAHKNVTVYIPPESSQSSGPEYQKIIEAGAAAAVFGEQTIKETDKE